MESPPPSVATDGCATGVDGIDESSLLAETEALLATLDPTAFVATASPKSPTGDRTDSDTSCTAFEASVAPGPESAQASRVRAVAVVATRKPGGGKKRVRAREKEKDKVVQLHALEQKLAKQLMVLRQSRSEAMAQDAKRLVVQIWRRVAERQMRMRQRVEAENQQLKAMMLRFLQEVDQQHNDAAVAVRLPMALPNHFHGPLKKRIGRTGDELMTLPHLFDSLLDRLDVAYAEMAAVFRENGLDQSLTEPRSFAQSKTRRSGSSGKETRYIELAEVGAIPFDARVVGNLLWRTLVAWHHKDNPYSYPCADRPNDTFAVNYRVKGGSFTANQSLDLKYTMRRYFARDRFVFVWAAQSDGENDLSDMYTIETGWMAISNIASLDASRSPIAVMQSCMHITARSKNEQRQPKKANLLASLVVSAVEEDVSFINQRLESLLLQEARSGGGQHGEKTPDPTSGARITFSE